MIRLICPGCEKTLQVNDNLAGRAVACPSCKTKFQVPEAEDSDEDPPSRKPAPNKTTAASSANNESKSPSKKRRDDDEDDDRPRSRRRDRDDDDEEDDRPRSRRRDDDDDDEDEDDRPRSRGKKKKKRKARSSSGGGFAAWSPVTKTLAIAAAFCAVCLLMSFFWPPMLIAIFIVCGVLSIVGGIGMIVVAFNESTETGLLYLFLPFYSLYYLISRFEDCKQMFLLQMGAILILIIASCTGLGIDAMINKPPGPPPQIPKADLALPLPAASPTFRV